MPRSRSAGGQDGFSGPHAQPSSGQHRKTHSNILTTKMASSSSIYLGTQELVPISQVGDAETVVLPFPQLL